MVKKAMKEEEEAEMRNSSMQSKYKGVRKRKWGKWVSEIRLPNSRERIWLGSFDTPEKAARAFDAAQFCLRGCQSGFNFPDNPPSISGGRSLTPPEIREAAARYANAQDDDIIITTGEEESVLSETRPESPSTTSVSEADTSLDCDLSFLDTLPNDFGMFSVFDDFSDGFSGDQFTDLGDWKAALMEADAAIVSGADFSPQLGMCKVEALLKLHRLDDARSKLLEVPKAEPFPSSCSQTRFSGIACEAYTYFVKAHIEMALGRFENAVMAAEKASKIDPRSNEVAMLHNTVTLVARARVRGNDLYKSERYTEASSAYAEGLRLDPCNAILYCNRAACWFKLGMWERSVEDCNQALRFQPRYTKPLLRRAACNNKMERWAAAVSDYEALRKELPHDKEVAESLFHAQVALKKSRGEEVLNMEFGGEVEEVYSREQFKAAMNLPGVSVIHFSTVSDHQCKQLSPFVDSLCTRYPSIHFLKVDIDKCPSIGNAENVRVVPTVKIYKNGTRVKEIVCPSKEVLEYSVRHYSG